MSPGPLTPAELRGVLGANLRQLADRYPSITDLARQLGINRTQFNRYLSGESFPRPDVLARICSFFNVDARILLAPVDQISRNDSVLTGPFLQDFVGSGLKTVSEDSFPSGFYQFTRRSFVMDGQYLSGLVRVFRLNGTVFARGFEAKEAMRSQGLPLDAASREYRGYATRQENGVALIFSRRRAMTCSFNYLSPVPSFENDHWAGYVTRTLPETVGGLRATRMVYRYLGRTPARALPCARQAGFLTEDRLNPFLRRLLRPDQPFA